MFSLYLRTNSTTVQLLVLLKTFFHSKPTALPHSFWFPRFYNHSPDTSAWDTFLSDHKPSALPYSFRFVFLFYDNFTQGLFNTNFTLFTNHQHYRTASGFSKVSLSKAYHQHYPTASGLPNNFITTSHQHYHTASGFLHFHLLTNHKHYFTASELSKRKVFFTPTALPYSVWFSTFSSAHKS